jgi:peptidoglycan/LPS O-acetylase OafA/YrhL
VKTLRSRDSHVPAIDGLRALAVLGVLIFHAVPALLPGGFTGVDVFFAISGYVVTGTLVRHASRPPLQFFTGFYARRVLRIFPALVVCLLAVSLAATAVVPQAWISQINDVTALRAFFGLSNFALVDFADGYFATTAESNPFTHTWSLAVEEQFYAVFPLVLFFWMRARDAQGAARRLARLALPGLALLSLGVCAVQTALQPQHAFYLIFSRFWELAAGALLFLAHQRGRWIPRSAPALRWVAASGLAALAISLALADAKRFPFPWALVPVGGTLLVMAAAVARDADASGALRILTNRPALYVGALSYSLYLWHWPVYVLLRWTAGLHGAANVALAVGVSALAAVASFHLVERPLRSSPRLVSLPAWQVLVCGGLVLASGFLLTSRIFGARARLSWSVTREMQTWQPRPWFLLADELPAVAVARVPGRLFVIGDSHAGAYGSLLREVQRQRGMPVVVHTIASCAVAGLLAPQHGACAEKIADAVAALEREAGPRDVVFLASLRMDRLVSQAGEPYATNVQSDEHAFDRELALEEARALIERLHAITPRLLIDAPKPVLPAPPFRCADRFNRHNPACAGGLAIARETLLERRGGVMASLQALQRRFPDLVVWDPFPVLCPGATCSAFDGDRPLYFDGDHLSGHGNDVLFPSFLRVLDGLQAPHEPAAAGLREGSSGGKVSGRDLEHETGLEPATTTLATWSSTN